MNYLESCEKTIGLLELKYGKNYTELKFSENGHAARVKGKCQCGLDSDIRICSDIGMVILLCPIHGLQDC